MGGVSTTPIQGRSHPLFPILFEPCYAPFCSFFRRQSVRRSVQGWEMLAFVREAFTLVVPATLKCPESLCSLNFYLNWGLCNCGTWLGIEKPIKYLPILVVVGAKTDQSRVHHPKAASGR